MDYEVVELQKKTVAGITARTSNNDEKMGQIIGGLWQRFFGEGIYAGIPNKQNDKSIGLYSDYATDVNGLYDITVCCEVSSGDKLPAGVTVKTIPAGRYAKFIVQGDMHKAVADFWTTFWKMELDRSYTADFEEYQPGEDMENMEIHMYISLN